MLTRRTVILAAKETVYGTDPALTGTNAVLAFDIDLDIKGEVLERDVLRDTLSRMPHVIGMKECALSFKTELKGVGLTGTAPTPSTDNALLYSGCGFGTGVYSGTSLVFSLVSQESQMGSIAFKVQKDGNYHKVLGARGTVKFVLAAGKYGVAEYAFQGLYDPVSAGTISDVTSLTENKPPIVYNSDFNIGGFSPVCSAAEIDVAVGVARRDSLNATYGVQAFRLTSRKPMLNFDADAVVESSNPFWGDWAGEIVDTFGVQIGSVPGNIVKFTGHFQYESNKYGDQDGVSKYDCTAALVSSSASSQDDELTITHI